MASRYGLLLVMIGLFLAVADYGTRSGQCTAGGYYRDVPGYCATGYFYLGCALAAIGVVIVFNRKIVAALQKPASEKPGP